MPSTQSSSQFVPSGARFPLKALCVITCFVLFLFATSGGPAAHAQSGINITYPANLSPATVICNVKNAPYNAKGDGTTDDTAAIQAALTANCKVVYLPNGTYRITGPLLWTYFLTGKSWGSYEMVGQTQTGAVLKLDNNLFTNTASPTIILNVCGDGSHGGCNSNSNYFGVGIRNLTLNTGSGNPGVIGIDFYGSNYAFVRDVTVTSADAEGVVGFDLEALYGINNANGPLLVKDLTVNGFQIGVEGNTAAPSQIGLVDSATFEHVYVNNQTVAGVDIQGDISMRDLESNQGATGIPGTNGYGGSGVPALTEEYADASTDGNGLYENSFLTLIDGTLTDGSAANSAIVINGAPFIYGPQSGSSALVRNITTSGYGNALVYGSATLASPIAEWTNDQVYAPFGGTGKTLGLPVKETPAATWDDGSTWDCVKAAGDSTGVTDYKNVQAAMNSGATTVCLYSGTYYFNNTVTVGGSVYHVVGIPGIALDGAGSVTGSTPIFQLGANGPPVVVFDNLTICSGCGYTLVNNPTSRTMVVNDGTGRVILTATGDNYIEDISTGFSVAHGNVWARQLNPEGGGVNVTNTGANVWILGQKQEKGGVTIQATGGQTELLGGVMYDCCGVGANAEFVVNNSPFSARIGEYVGNNDPTSYWPNFVQDTEGSLTWTIQDSAGAAPGVLGLYTNATGSGPSLAPAPRLSPGPGTFNTAQTLTMIDSNPDTIIHYTTDGSVPTVSSTLYTAPILLPDPSTTTIKAIAAVNGMENSTMTYGLYKLTLGTVATPTFSPAAGGYGTAQTVTISETTPGATIYYTTDGTTPSSSSTTYTAPITVSTTETVEALAAKSSYTTSTTGSATYTIGGKAAKPTFSPAAGTYNSAQTVTINDTSNGATIYYTVTAGTTGVVPTTGSTKYTAPIAISGTSVVEAIASGGDFTTSSTGSATYTLQLPQTITSFTPSSPVTYGVTPITLSATGGASGNPVTFNILSGGSYGSLSGANNSILTIKCPSNHRDDRLRDEGPEERRL